MLQRVQQLDPPGIAARSVSECIELQLRQLEADTPGLATAIAIARSHLELVAGRELSLLRRELKATEEEIACALVLVRGLPPPPGCHHQRGLGRICRAGCFCAPHGPWWLVG